MLGMNTSLTQSKNTGLSCCCLIQGKSRYSTTMLPNVPMQPVDSSSIKELGYDPFSGTLAVRFYSGSTYHFKGVSQEAYESLSSAESIGKHFHEKIKSQHT